MKIKRLFKMLFLFLGVFALSFSIASCDDKKKDNSSNNTNDSGNESNGNENSNGSENNPSDNGGSNESAHQFIDCVVAPTCEEKGYTLHLCIDGDIEIKDNFTNALGHTYNNHICRLCGACEFDNVFFENMSQSFEEGFIAVVPNLTVSGVGISDLVIASYIENGERIVSLDLNAIDEELGEVAVSARIEGLDYIFAQLITEDKSYSYEFNSFDTLELLLVENLRLDLTSVQGILDLIHNEFSKGSLPGLNLGEITPEEFLSVFDVKFDVDSNSYVAKLNTALLSTFELLFDLKLNEVVPGVNDSTIKLLLNINSEAVLNYLEDNGVTRENIEEAMAYAELVFEMVAKELEIPEGVTIDDILLSKIEGEYDSFVDYLYSEELKNYTVYQLITMLTGMDKDAIDALVTDVIGDGDKKLVDIAIAIVKLAEPEVELDSDSLKAMYKSVVEAVGDLVEINITKDGFITDCKIAYGDVILAQMSVVTDETNLPEKEEAPISFDEIIIETIEFDGLKAVPVIVDELVVGFNLIDEEENVSTLKGVAIYCREKKDYDKLAYICRVKENNTDFLPQFMEFTFISGEDGFVFRDVEFFDRVVE